jgi:hypothetical protein
MTVVNQLSFAVVKIWKMISLDVNVEVHVLGVNFFTTLVLMLIPIICLCRGIVAPNVGNEKFSRIVFVIVGKT